MWDFFKEHPVVFNTTALILISILIIYIAYLVKWLTSKGKDIEITKDGLKIKSSIKNIKSLDPKEVVSGFIEITNRMSELYINQTDKIHSIKNRIFKQSIEYCHTSLIATCSKIIEEYKLLYLKKYTGMIDCNDKKNNYITREQLDNDNKEMINPCVGYCEKGCNSGIYYFECRLEKDVKNIKKFLDDLIQENHLINRQDREYEEEIKKIAERFVYELSAKVLAYTIPIDNVIAAEVMEKYKHDFISTIEDILRRSRTLSKAKRDEIFDLKSKTESKKTETLKTILSFIDGLEINGNKNISDEG